jgi:hypothetical protein
MGLFQTVQRLVIHFYDQFTTTQPRPSLHPIPGTKPLTIEAAILPPLLYYVALLFLPPAPPPALESIALKTLRTLIALTAGILFLRLPLAYHVPQSIGLTYQVSHLDTIFPTLDWCRFTDLRDSLASWVCMAVLELLTPSSSALCGLATYLEGSHMSTNTDPRRP